MSRFKNNLFLLIFFLSLVFGFFFAFPQYRGSFFDFIPNVPFRLGLDLQGGTHLVYEADLSQVEKSQHKEVMEGLRDVIERRINIFGVREPLVQVQRKGDNYRLIVELAGVMDPAQAIEMIGKTPYLEFREERPKSETEEILKLREEIQEKLKDKKINVQEGVPDEIKKIPNWEKAFEDPYFKPTKLTGRYLKGARVSFDPTTNEPLVSLEFNEEGAKIFADLTKRNVGKRLAIYIDGKLISAPVVQEEILGGKAQITGHFTLEQAKELARNLNAGALPVPIKLISQETVGPTLGKSYLEKSLKAGILGLAGVALFMILFYRFSGLLAVVALFFYVIFNLFLYKIIPVTLTLAGIGGFILSVGMAVDANVLIFSRMREEIKNGKGLDLAIVDGVRRAWPSIRDGNITTLIVAILLYMGTGFVKGFATTLILGILISMFSAVVVTKFLLRYFVNYTKLGKITKIW